MPVEDDSSWPLDSQTCRITALESIGAEEMDESVRKFFAEGVSTSKINDAIGAIGDELSPGDLTKSVGEIIRWCVAFEADLLADEKLVDGIEAETGRDIVHSAKITRVLAAFETHSLIAYSEGRLTDAQSRKFDSLEQAGHSSKFKKIGEKISERVTLWKDAISSENRFDIEFNEIPSLRDCLGDILNGDGDAVLLVAEHVLNVLVLEKMSDNIDLESALSASGLQIALREPMKKYCAVLKELDQKNKPRDLKGTNSEIFDESVKIAAEENGESWHAFFRFVMGAEISDNKRAEIFGVVNKRHSSD